MASVFHRWASLGLFVPGEIDPYEDPEQLLMQTLVEIETEGRLLGMVTSWVAKYGHLLITKKLRFKSERERRLFSAIVEESGNARPKLRRLVAKGTVRKRNFLYRDDLEVLKRVAGEDPNRRFLRHGFILKNAPLVREEIVLPPEGVYKRSLILRKRALYGSSLRSDFLTILPEVSGRSVRQIAQRLHVASQTLEPIVREYVESGLMEWKRSRRWSTLAWSSTLMPLVK